MNRWYAKFILISCLVLSVAVAIIDIFFKHQGIAEYIPYIDVALLFGYGLGRAHNE